MNDRLMTMKLNDDELVKVGGGKDDPEDTVRVSCPYCGTPFRLKVGATSGICPGCGETVTKTDTPTKAEK